MVEIIIHRCTLRVVRRGGWSWGEDPKRLAQDVVRNIPSLLAERLAALLPEDDAREFSAPIRLRIPIRMRELLGKALTESGTLHNNDSWPTASFKQRLDSVLRAAFFDLGLEPERPEVFADRLARAVPTGGGEVGSGGARESDALRSLLLCWAKEGVLEGRLTTLSKDQIAAWHDALLREVKRHGVTEEQPEFSISARIDAFLRVRADSVVAQTPTGRLRQRILLASEAAEQLDVPLTHYLLWQALDRSFPLGPPLRPQHNALAQDSAIAAREKQIDAGLAPTLQTRSMVGWDARIKCALPFLLLGPLTRLGYVAALAAVLEAADLTEEAPLFAAALAYKVLDPPERGWRRSPASVLAASAFAGSRDAIKEESLVDFSRRIAPHTSALDLILADAVIAGHVPGEPVVLCRKDSESTTDLLLVDTPGSFPLACANCVEQLLPILRRLSAPILMISSDAAIPRLMNDLDAAGLTFVIDAPPTRHEIWQPVRQGVLRLGWTKSLEPGSERVLRAARKLAVACDEAKVLWRELAAARPAVVRACSSELESSLTLAAGVGMGLVSWKLWQDTECTNPQRALYRYSDLDARIRFDRASVIVSLPLGRRHQELGEAGLLTPIDGIPWLDGRRIEFSGG